MDSPAALCEKREARLRVERPEIQLIEGTMRRSNQGVISEALPLFRFISGEHAHDVALLHDKELVPIQFDLGA
jgi:hypothetical protein